MNESIGDRIRWIFARWRWRLARRVAGVAIVQDPTEGRESAAVVVMRSGTTVTTWSAEKFRIRHRMRLSAFAEQLADDPKFFGDPTRFGGVTVTTFVGITVR